MPSSATRKGVWALLAGLALLALLAAALPLVASTQIVRDRIAHEMSAWSGFRVELGEAPEIRIWPFRAILSNVTLSEWSGESKLPVIQAERVEIDLSAMPALLGDVVFSKARFIRPILRLKENEAGSYLPALPNTGRIIRAVEIGREAIAANPADPDFAALPADGFGAVEFSGGRIVISLRGIDRELISSIAGTGTWPALNRAGTVSAAGIWRGEAIAVDISSPQPLVLFGGGAAALKFQLKAPPLEASFNGAASLSQGFLDGAASLSSPSLRRALEWSRMHITPGSAIGAVTLEARVTGAGNRFSFQDTKLSLGGNPGTGALDLSVVDGTPGISGTLAFDHVDLLSFMSAFTVPPKGGEGSNRIDASFTDQVNLDLRLSAATAKAGAIALTDVAATAQVKSGLAVFDISDATAFAGTVQTGFRLDRTKGGNHAEIRLLATDIDSAALAKATGAHFVPQGAATISAMLKGPVASWDSLLDTTQGSVSVKMPKGAIAGIDVPLLLKRAGEGGFFPLVGAPEGSLALEGAELAATLSKGVAMIDKAEALTPQGTISLRGSVPYVGRGLALSGTITPQSEGDAESEQVSFFIGGPWSAPFISPVIPELPDQRW